MTRDYTVNCPYCHRKLGPFAGYRPGLIRCGACGKAFNLR
jgi:DNA-directed RNA polymerase subunit RPC12/RpoP